MVVLKPNCNAIPPAAPADVAPPPAPPIPTINPLFTKVTVSPAEPPLSVNPGVPVLVEYRYTLELTVMVMSEVPAAYPEMEVTLSEALAVLDAKVCEITLRFDFPYPLLMLIAPEGTAKSVRTVAWFILIDVVPANPNSTLTLLREIGPDAGSVMFAPYGVS
jgi:hypothetical protein